MVKAKLETKTGMNVSIVGETKEVGDLLEYMMRREKVLRERKLFFERMRENRERRLKERNEYVGGKRNVSLTNVLEIMINKTFFDSPKHIREIMENLEKEGVFAPTSTIHPLLSRLVAKGRLKRSKNENGLWEYKKNG